ncbi:hypothetical protein OSB04_009809 [Centaurea solstitialis]|uniref:G-patch domain-containing protein n=1 Tax=Centaurea solstitialis TaxID=347529 RepID=A0AA38T6B4_9ASTR|nr:hypothetical protein OSB04_009809 [Centaurea solstitialis]
MKLSFSLGSSKPPKPTLKSSADQSKKKEFVTGFESSSADQSSSKKEFLTEFDPSKTLPDSDSKTHVIAPIANHWRPKKKMRNIDLPVKSDDPNLQFEVANSTVEPVDPNITYGLNLRSKKDSKKDTEVDSEPIMDRVQPASSIENLMLNKLRNDLEKLPEDRGMDEFTDVPVEDFAAALLKGYGWYEGRGIGKNAKEDVKVVEYERRSGKQGLGFVDDAPVPPTNDKSNRSGITKKGDDSKFHVGKDVRIVGGKEAGLKGRVVEVIARGSQVVLKLSRSQEEVVVYVRDVADLGSVEEERCLKKLTEKVRVPNGGDRKSKDSTGSHGGSKRSRERHEVSASSSVSWLNSNIRVRIVSKAVKKGRLYLQKGVIVDVVGPTTCDISMDNSRELIQGVEQDFLETALPRQGGPVLVLYGKHKGVFGSLQEKDMDKETAVSKSLNMLVILMILHTDLLSLFR